MRTVLIGGACVVLIAFKQAQAGLLIQSESAVFDPLSNRIDFTITFDRSPDFYTVDSFGRQADAFQYWIFYDNNPFQPPANPFLDALIRGGEIFVAGDLRIRDSRPPAVGDPYYGGWGEIRATVPFVLSGTTISFSADLVDIGDSDGQFAYRLETYEFGATRDTVFGGTAGPYDTDTLKPIPEPVSVAIWGGLSLVGPIAGWRRERARRVTAQ